MKLNKKTIEKGKKYAKKRNTSLSKMVENYLNKLTQTEDSEITPLVRSLTGVLRGESKDYKSGYADYLEKKYR